MELTSVYRRAPGCCSVCSTTTADRGVIDLQTDDMANQHRSFAVYLCGACAMQIATMIAPVFDKTIVSSDIGDQLVAVMRERDEARTRLMELDTIMAQIRSVPS
jgi:hypothetical protein